MVMILPFQTIYTYMSFKNTLENRCLRESLILETNIINILLIMGCLLTLTLISTFEYTFGLLIYAIILLIIAIEDIIHKQISNQHIIFLFIINILMIILHRQYSINYYIIGLIFPSTILLIISIFSNYQLGMGDVKLISVIGMSCGTITTLRLLSYTCIFSGMISIIMIGFKLLKLKDTLPFAPFIVISYFIVTLIS